MTSAEPHDPRPSSAMRDADLANGEGPGPDDLSTDRAARRPRCVLIAVDESDEAVRTAQAAMNLMGEDAHYVLVNVGSDTLPWATDPLMWGTVPPSMILLAPDSNDQLRDDAGQLPGSVDRAEATASAVAASAGLDTAEAVGTTGRDRGTAICTVAREHGADVIVIGQRHRSWLDRMFSRSVTDDVLRKAGCPVLVIP